jgi:hypothetical protein
LEVTAGWIDVHLAAGEEHHDMLRLQTSCRLIIMDMVYLDGDEPLIAGLISQREHRYMPARCCTSPRQPADALVGPT